MNPELDYWRQRVKSTDQRCSSLSAAIGRAGNDLEELSRLRRQYADACIDATKAVEGLSLAKYGREERASG